jgi:hypothetical protein
MQQRLAELTAKLETSQKQPSEIAQKKPSKKVADRSIVQPGEKLLTTAKAYAVAKSRGCAKTKNGFCTWSKRQPSELKRLYRLQYLGSFSNDTTVPRYKDLG